jgi:hypothetical protein
MDSGRVIFDGGQTPKNARRSNHVDKTIHVFTLLSLCLASLNDGFGLVEKAYSVLHSRRKATK